MAELGGDLSVTHRIMKKTLACLVAVMAFLFGGVAADSPNLYDGNDHGDPPFLLEDGWKPLLNGTNLDGWRYRAG